MVFDKAAFLELQDAARAKEAELAKRFEEMQAAAGEKDKAQWAAQQARQPP